MCEHKGAFERNGVIDIYDILWQMQKKQNVWIVIWNDHKAIFYAIKHSFHMAI